MKIWKMYKDSDYFVSSHGEVLSKGGRLLKQHPDGRGYPQVVLYLKGVRKSERVHRMIIEVFKGSSKLEVHHIDNNKRNNYIDNLDYVTRLENMTHASKAGFKIGLKRQARGSRKLTNQDIQKIRIMYKENRISQQVLADIFKVSQPTIHNLIKKKTWRCV